MTRWKTTNAMRYATLLGILAATVMSQAGAAQPKQDDLIGSWMMQEQDEHGLSSGIRITSIDERGRATGTYCSTWEDGSIFGFDLRPKGGVKSTVKDGVLNFARSKRKYALSVNEDGTMLFEFSSEGKKSGPRALVRSEPSGCLARFVPAAEHAVHSVAEEDESEFVGVWKGTTKDKLKMEIHVAEVGHDGQATAIHDHSRGAGPV